jgi:hypothetical protein
LIKIELPSYEEFERIIIKLDKPRVIEYKDGRKSNPNIISFTPLEFKKQSGRKGVYIILKDGKVRYVGATEDLFKRLGTHKFLIKNPKIKEIYFLELNDKVKRYFYEIYYKYYYFGKVSLEYKGTYT